MPSAAQALEDDSQNFSINLLRVEAGMRKDVISLLEDLETDLVRQIEKQELAGADAKKLKKFRADTEQQIKEAYTQIASLQKSGLEGVGKLSTANLAKSVDATLKVKLTKQLTENQLATIAKGPLIQGNPSADWWRGQDEGLRRKFNGQVQMGLANGEDMASIVRRIRGTQAAGYKDGVMNVPKHEADALVRTSVQSMANQTAIDTMTENADVIKGVRWLATLDSRTTHICKSLAGKKWRLPDYEPVGHDKAFPGPVAHWGCRSVPVAETYSWAELAGKKVTVDKESATYRKHFEKRLAQQGFAPDEIKEIRADQQASMDGPVSNELGWDGWLKSKTDAEARELLGPGRHKLWKEEKITLTDLTDQTGRELTIAELLEAIENGTAPNESEGVDYLPAPKKVVPIDEKQEEKSQQLLQNLIDNPKGQTLKSKWAKKAETELPGSSFTEKLAWAEAKAAEQQAAASKASALSQAKKKILSGKPLTTGQQKVYDGLTDEERQAFDEAVSDATKVKKADTKQEVLDALGTGPVIPESAMDKYLDLFTTDPDAAKAITEQIQKNVIAINDAKAAEQGQKAAKKQVEAMEKGHSIEQDAIKAAKETAAEMGDLSDQDILEIADDVAADLATDAIAAIIKDPKSFPDQKAALENKYGLKEGAASKKLLTDLVADEDPLALVKEVEAIVKAKQSIIPPPPTKGLDIEPKRNDATIPEPSKLKKVRSLGGSTGAMLMEDSEGKQYVMKRGAEPDHVRAEFAADRMYEALGVKVPAGELFETEDGPVKITRFIEDGQSLGSLSKAEQAKAIKKLQKNFEADALLGNWDVAGTGLDNVLVTPDGEVWRVDNGGSLEFRAQGSKIGKQFDRFPEELFSMREPGNISEQIYGKMSTIQVSKQIQKAKLEKILETDMPDATRAILTERIKEMRIVANRAVDFDRDGHNPEPVHRMARATLDIRKEGLSDQLPKQLRNRPGEEQMLTDENGKLFGKLRSTGLPPAYVKHPSDEFGIIDIATKSVIHTQGKNKDKLGVGTTYEIDGAIGHKAKLQSLQKTGDEDEKKMATSYLKQIEELEKAKQDIKHDLPPFEPFKKKTLAKNATESLIRQWEAMMTEEEIDFSPIGEWMEAQSGNSWSPVARGMKVAIARQYKDPETQFYWEGGANADKPAEGWKEGWKEANKEYEKLVKKAGGQDKMDRLVSSWQALTQEQLSTIDAPWIDKENRAVLLIRTVAQEEIDGGFQKADKDGIFIPKRGTTESHGIYKRYFLNGNITTVQAVPFSRVLATYWAEKPGKHGGGGFAGDWESEFSANTSGIPAKILGNNDPLPGFDEDSKKMSTWGVPTDHIR